MQVVTDGDAYYLLHRALGAECRLRRLLTGETTTLPCESLAPARVEAALAAVGDDLEDQAVGSNKAAALLLELALGGPASARELLDRFDVCESDLHGAVSELRAAGLLEQTSVYGERGYRVTTTVDSNRDDP